MTLHYIYDPLCGWCYGSAPLLRAARQMNGIEIALHAGGMMMGARRQPVTPAMRDFVITHDRRVAQLTGQPFGAAYHQGFLLQPGAIFDSEPPIAAILAAEDQGLKMLERIQHAHFVEGHTIADPAVLRKLAVDIGLDEQQFTHLYETSPTQQHVDASRALLHQVGGQGFPTFACQTNGHWLMLDSSTYLGRVDEWLNYLRSL